MAWSMEFPVDLAVVLLLVLANGFFVAAEFSLVTVRRTRIDQLVAAGGTRARAVRRALTDQDRYIAATQLGITIASIGLGWIGEPAIASVIEPLLRLLPESLAETTLHTISAAVGFGVITTLHIVLGELAPKTIALQRAEATALWVAVPTEVFMRIFWPFIAGLNALGRWVVRAIGVSHPSEHGYVHSPEELQMLMMESEKAGLVQPHEREMLRRAFEIGELTAADLMRPRTELPAIAVDASLADLRMALGANPPEWLAAYQRGSDDVMGIVLVRDVSVALLRSEAFDVARLVREIPTVPETAKVDDVLLELQRRQAQHAVVIDEYGGLAGILSADDVNRRIAGNLATAAAGTETSPQPASVDGLMLVIDANRRFGLHIDESRFKTLGGFMLGHLGMTARVGDELPAGSWTLTVEALDGLRISRIRLERSGRSISHSRP